MSGYLNVYDLIAGRAQDARKIISFYEDFNLISQKSFQEINQDVQIVSKRLASQLEKNEIFFVSLPNSYDFLVVFLASLKAGVVPAPIASPDSMLKTDYYDYLDELKSNTQIQKIIVPEATRGEMVRNGFEVVSMMDISSQPDSERAMNNPQMPKMLPDSLADKIAYIQFSSGSTSFPKGIMISHNALIENITSIRLSLELNERSILISWLPFYHDMGLVGTLLTPLLSPFESHIIRPNDFTKAPERFLEMTSRLHVTIWAGPDSMYRSLSRVLNQNKLEINLSSLTACISGSEPVLFDTFNQFKKVAVDYGWNPLSFVAAYGQAENVLAISFSPLRSYIKTYEKNRRQVVSCGKPTRDIKVQILDENQRLVKDGIEGMIWIQSPSLCSGFLDHENEFKSLCLGSWFFTGDLGFIKEGDLYVSGRQKNLIISGSKRHFSEDLEQRVWNLIGHDRHSKTVAVVGKGFIGGDEAVTVCIEWQDLFPPLSFRQRRDFRNKIIHHFKNQFKISKKDIIFIGIKALPRTTSGKLKRYLIRTRVQKNQLGNSLWSIFWRSWLMGFIFSK